MTKVISSLALLSTLLLISSYDCLKIRNKSSNPYYIPHTGNDPYDWYGEQLAKEGSSKSSNPYYIPHTGNDPYDWYGEQLVKK